MSVLGNCSVMAGCVAFGHSRSSSSALSSALLLTTIGSTSSARCARGHLTTPTLIPPSRNTALNLLMLDLRSSKVASSGMVMGRLRRFTRVLTTSTNTTAAQTGDLLQSIELMLYTIEQKLALLNREEAEHNINLDALAIDMLVPPPKLIRSDTDAIYAKYSMYHYNYECLQRKKNATKAETVALLAKVQLLADICDRVKLQATQTTATVFRRPGAFVHSDLIDVEEQSSSLLYRGSRHKNPDKIMSELCGF